MGFAISMFVAVIFASMLLVSAANYDLYKEARETVPEAERAYLEDASDRAHTDLTIVHTRLNGTGDYICPPGTSCDTANATANYTLQLTIRNNGSVSLNPAKLSVLVNATWINITTSTSVWPPLTNITVNTSNFSFEPHRVLAVTGNGVKVIPPEAPFVSSTDTLYGDNTTNCRQFEGVNECVMTTFSALLSNIPFSDSSIKYYNIYYYNYNIYGQLTPFFYTTMNKSWLGDTSKCIYFRRSDYYYCILYSDQLTSENDPSNPDKVFWFLTAVDIHGNEGPPSNAVKPEV